MSEPTLVVHHREQLAELLTEAVDVEHNLMCCYLYAAWSLKAGEADGLTAEQADAVGRWRNAILHVAIDEMTHFANANNILAAIGARPRIGRPNFPVGPGLHPADVLVALHPFDESTIQHFVFLERPEGVDEPDGSAFHHDRTYVRATSEQKLMPSAQDFATVGHLYRGIEDGLRSLAAELGEEALFVGSKEAQIRPDHVQLDGLVAVTDLASALQAVANIVEQGEGNVDNPESSHYRRFCAVRDELAALTAADPSFQPARPVAHNPVQRQPPEPRGKVWIGAPDAARVLDLGNAVYNHMLRTLGSVYSEVPDAARAGLVGEAIGLMKVLVPLNGVLTRLPAHTAPEPTAGMSFAVTRAIRVPPAESAVPVLSEATASLAAGARRLADVDPAFTAMADDLARMATRLGRLPRGLSGAPAAADTASATSGTLERSSDPSIPPREIVDGVEIVQGEHIELHFDTKRCIHTRYCVLGSPEVFVGNVVGPWLRPDAVDPERLAELAHSCPSGAVRYRRKDGRPDEQPPTVNRVRVYENGPYAVTADLRITGDAGPRVRAVLCRCGRSKRKPFCDGSHADGFVATGEIAKHEDRVEDLDPRGGALDVVPQQDGPLIVRGPVEICRSTGATVAKVTKCALCRCGQSSNKPFCDGTHAKVGFKSADTSEI
ncbi:MAG: CDGSH iron-sulfur domain-containing protein [Alphaproteobacteria bacterium]|nr:CDGSH iron-sulfur domain-containing protein [Alphaproteobacteria bacterium]